MNPRQEEGERGGCTIKRKGGGMVSEGVKGVKEGKGGRGGRGERVEMKDSAEELGKAEFLDGVEQMSVDVKTA